MRPGLARRADHPGQCPAACCRSTFPPAAGLDPLGRGEHRHGADLLPGTGHSVRARADCGQRDRPGPAGTEAAAAGPSTKEFSRPSGQWILYEVNTVLAGGSFTSLVWTIRARSPGPGSISTAQPQIRRSGVGPALRAPDRHRQAGGCDDRAVPVSRARQPGRPGLQNLGDEVTVVTNFPALPRGTTSVDVVFPEVGPVIGVTVSASPEGAYRAGGDVTAETEDLDLPPRPSAGRLVPVAGGRRRCRWSTRTSSAAPSTASFDSCGALRKLRHQRYDVCDRVADPGGPVREAFDLVGPGRAGEHQDRSAAPPRCRR